MYTKYFTRCIACNTDFQPAAKGVCSLFAYAAGGRMEVYYEAGRNKGAAAQ